MKKGFFKTLFAPKSKKLITNAYHNEIARTGLFTNNLASGASEIYTAFTRNRMAIESLYRSSWIVGAIVDIPSEDMTRPGIRFKNIEPQQEGQLLKFYSKINLLNSFCDGLKWARLYGGAIGIILIDGDDPSTPLREKQIVLNSFKGVYFVDRWVAFPELSDPIQEIGPEMGLPKYYKIVDDNLIYPGKLIHHSRIIRFTGIDLPYYQRRYENLWGLSIVERCLNQIMSYMGTTDGAAQLVFRAHIRFLKLKGYMDLLSGIGGPKTKNIRTSVNTRLDDMRYRMSNEGLTVIDADDDIGSMDYNFSGLDGVLNQFKSQIAGCAGIPITRLFGESPGGMNSTGESDIRGYYDNIDQKRQIMLGNPLARINDIAYQSIFGMQPPSDFYFEFKELWQLSATEKSNIFSERTNAIVSAVQSGIINQTIALQELKAGGEIDGGWESITPEAIEDSKGEPPPAPQIKDYPAVNDNNLFPIVNK